jgi:menaquinone-dependent protoporphyrinogen oxidase
MRILIVHGSKMGGTAGLAEMIGQALTEHGLEVTVRPAGDRPAVDGFDAVIVAGAIYNRRWQADARKFVRRNVAALRERPVWLAASGPLDDSARDGALPPVPHVAQCAAAIGAQATVTFGGRLSSDAPGFLARSMAKTMAGDWRNSGQVTEFAEQVATALTVEPAS